MGAVESKDEENSTVRFVDSVEVRHEKGGAVHGNDDLSTDYVPEGKGNVQEYKYCEIHNRSNCNYTLSYLFRISSIAQSLPRAVTLQKQ